MKKLLRLGAIAALVIGIFTTQIFAVTTDQAKPRSASQKGFLGNLKELKEVSDIMDIILDNHVGKELPTKDQVLEGAIKGMVDSLDDPHSIYFTKDELDKFKEDIKGKYVGVGMVIQKKKNEALTVVSPIEDTPAYKAGIKPKDKIIEIDGKSTYKLTSQECVELLKGKADTDVTVTIYRESIKEKKEIVLTRAIVNLKYVKHKMLEGNIGYLRLTQFGEDVYKDMKKAMNSLVDSGMEGLVLDLRNNPGWSFKSIY